jgi:hypothetical protein
VNGWPAAFLLPAAVAACSGSSPEVERPSDEELSEIAWDLESAVGPAVVVSTAEELGLVVILVHGPEPDFADVVEATCEAVLDRPDGPDFSFFVVNADGTADWHGTTADLERCPPR